MVNLIYEKSETGKYTLTLRHNAYGETLAGKESEDNDKYYGQVKMQSDEIIQWVVAGNYVSFQLSDLIIEEEAELTINWVEHVTDTFGNWLVGVTSKTGTLTYSKTQFEQVPLKLTTKTIVLE